MRQKTVKSILGLFVAFFFVLLFFRQVDTDLLLKSSQSVDKRWLTGGFGLLLAGYAARIMRWRHMLALDNPRLRAHQCAGPFLAAFALNNVLPFRLGDVARTFAFSSQLGVAPTLTLSTLLIERLLDLLAVFLLLGMAIAIFGVDINRLLGLSALALIALATGALLLLASPRLLTAVLQWSVRVLTRLGPRHAEKMVSAIDRVRQLLTRLSQRNNVITLFIWSMAAWIAEGGVYWCLAKSLSTLKVTEASWLAMPIGTLATLIPSTPGYIGTFDYFTAQAMHIAGNELAAASAYALLVHLMLWFPVTALGGIYLLFSPVRRLTARKESGS